VESRGKREKIEYAKLLDFVSFFPCLLLSVLLFNVHRICA
jgi:hypothetical protein